MKLVALPPLLIAVLSLYLSLYHLIIYIKGGRQYRKNLLLALTSLFIGCFDILASLLYNSSSLAEGAFWQTKQPFASCMGTVFLLWFIHDYAKLGQDRALKIISIVAVVGSFITLFDKSKLSWQFDTPCIKIHHFPFDHTVIFYEIKSGVITEMLIVLLMVAMLHYLARAALNSRRHNFDNPRPLPLILSSAIFLISAVSDFAVTEGYYHFPYLFEYSFLSFILLMTYSLSKGVLESAIMKDQLKSERDLLQSLMDNIPDLIYFKDSDFKFLQINKALKNMLGLKSYKEICGKTADDVFPDEQAAICNEDDLYIKQTGQPIIGKLLRERLPGGKNRWVSATKVPIFNENQQLDKIIGISHDITEMKRTTEALEHAKIAAESANQVKSQFMANMSHELRTPMNGILGMTDLALNTDSPTEQKEYLRIIDQSANNLLELLNALLNVTDIENENIGLEITEFDLTQLIAEVIHHALIQAKTKNIRMSHHIQSDVPSKIKGDRTRLRQILMQLVGNAVKFTNNGEVKLDVNLNQEFRENVLSRGDELTHYLLQFDISDTGIGIAADKLNDIFSPFYQVDGSFTRKYGGTGIGLSITSKLVHLMGGEVWVDSELGKGSTFHFTFLGELGAESHPDQSSDMVQEMLSENRSYHVLLVEDNYINKKVAIKILEKAGHSVVVASNGMEALEKLADDDRFDFVLMDLQMPEMDGYEATEKIRALPEFVPAQKIPIIALTAHALKEDKDRCKSIGMNGFLTKPIDTEQLFEEISRVMQSHKVFQQAS
ncbi:response regulator [candidate division KSB1 bacterium]|nr:response regulator [candidate division KSB1 bacterium]